MLRWIKSRYRANVFFPIYIKKTCEYAQIYLKFLGYFMITGKLVKI